MIAAALALLLSAPQDPTVEDRIRELETRLTSLEKRAAAARAENDQLAKKIAATEAAREKTIRAWAASWVKRHAEPAGLSGERRAELTELWVGWFRADLSKRPTVETWTAREKEIKGRLSPEEAAKLAGAVRQGQEATVAGKVGTFVREGKLEPESGQALEKKVRERIRIRDGMLLTAAHPEGRVDWLAVCDAVKKSLPELDGVLSADERTRLEALIEKWKPRTIKAAPSRKK